jgi:cold shock protein
MEDKKVYQGKVCWFKNVYGFITPDDGTSDIFVHYSDISIEGYRTLKKGQKVQYELGLNIRGIQKAVCVVPIK